MAIKVNDDYYVMINGAKFDHLTSCTLTRNKEEIDITSMDSSGDKDFAQGDSDGTVSIEALYDPAATEGGDEALADLEGTANHTILVTSATSGDTTFSSSGFPTSWSINSSKGSPVTLSVTYRLTGALTIGAVA